MGAEKNQVVIIGAGQAAAMAALALREEGFLGRIVMVGDEDALPYERPELSKGYLEGSVPFSQLTILEENALVEANVDVLRATTVRQVLVQERAVLTSGEQLIGYAHLIFATGGRARTLEGCLALRTKQDADAIQARLESCQSLAVLGAGWLGLELAALAHKRGHSVMVFDPAPRLCARVLPEVCSQRLLELHDTAGLAFNLGSAPQTEEIIGAYDLTIACIGMIPNDALAAGAGLDCDGGILVAPNQETSVSNVYAIGDCARHTDAPRLESWAYANSSAKRAAAAICNRPIPAVDPPWFWSQQGDTLIQMIGDFAERNACQMVEDADGKTLWHFTEAGQLVGAIGFNHPRGIGRARRSLA